MSDYALYTVTSESTIGCYCSRQFCNFIPVSGYVGIQVIFQSECSLITITEIQFNTHVLHFSCIDPLAASFTHSGDTSHLYQDIRCLFVEPVEWAVKRLFEKWEIETQVDLCGCFPFDVIVTDLVTLESRLKDTAAIGSGNVIGSTVALTTWFRHTVVGNVNSIAGNVRDFLVTGLAPWAADFQVVNPTEVLHEIFTVQAPSQWERRECSIAVILTETWRTVTAYCHREQIFIIIRIIQFSEERNQWIAFARTVSLSRTGTCIRPHIVGRQDGIIFFIARKIDIVFAVQLHTDHGVTTVFANFQIVGSDGIPHPFRPVFLLGFYGILIICHITFGDRVGEDALWFLCIIQSEGRAYIESFEGIEVDVSITKHTPVSIAIIRVTIQSCHRVFAVRVSTYRTGIFSIDIINRQWGIELQYILQESAWCLYFRSTVQGEMFSYGQEFANQVVIRVHTGRETFEVAVLDDAYILIVTQGEERRTLFWTVAYWYIVLLDNTCTGGFVKPVSIGSRHSIGGI